MTNCDIAPVEMFEYFDPGTLSCLRITNTRLLTWEEARAFLTEERVKRLLFFPLLERGMDD